MKKIFAEKEYFVQVLLFAVIGFIIIFQRSRLGVELTDEVWYSSDPYWVAKSSIPYVNNWTQASGFTLPLYTVFAAFLNINGSSVGIILFARTLYCVWKTVVSVISFSLLNKAGYKIPTLLVIPVIVFAQGQVFDINYNTIGWSYMLLVLSVLANIFTDNRNNKQKYWIGVVAGILIGRSVIGTLATISVCIIAILILLLRKEWIALRGVITGGVLAALIVISYCCIRGGFTNFIIGIQYFVRDQAYYDSVTSYKIPFMEGTVNLFNYMKPAIVSFAIVIVLKIILRKRLNFFNKLLSVYFVGLLFLILRYISQYDGSGIGLRNSTRLGWFIPLLSLFLCVDADVKKKFEYVSYISLSYFMVYVIQGYVSNYGFYAREYWNLIPMLLGIYVTFVCLEEIFGLVKIKYLKPLLEVLVCLLVVIPIVRGAYCYVYRDMPCQELDTKVESGIWKGCYTTEQRAAVVVEIEKEIKRMTKPEDQVLCYGNWACFLNLLSNGQLCAPNAIGTGQKNGFDYWHMYQKVPTKILIHVDEEDVQGRMTSAFELWNFIEKFYEQTDEYDYINYNESGQQTLYRILQFEITDYNAALAYADEKATKIYEPGKR